MAGNQEGTEADEINTVAGALQSDLNEFANRVIDLNYGFPVAMGWASVSGLLHQEEVKQFAIDHGEEEKDGGKDASYEGGASDMVLREN